MQTPCAYCKEIGHDIRSENVMKETKVSPHPNATNKFAQLYSSDEEEIEEGEIVEDLSVRFAGSCSFSYDSDSDSNSDSSRENEWSRSGTRSIRIPQVVQIAEEEEEESRYYNPEFDYYNIPGGDEILAFIEKMRGMSWADIECDSDFE